MYAFGVHLNPNQQKEIPVLYNTETFTHHGETYELAAMVATAMVSPLSKAADIVVWYMPQGPQLQALRDARMQMLEQYL